jgi:hypothetical protein
MVNEDIENPSVVDYSEGFSFNFVDLKTVNSLLVFEVFNQGPTKQKSHLEF